MYLIRIPITIVSVLLCLVAGAQNHVRFSLIQPGMRDRELASMAIDAANKWAADYHWPEQYTDAVIISQNWEPETGKSGRITGRRIHVLLLCKKNDGRCGIGNFTFRERLMKDRPEGTYRKKLEFVSNAGVYDADCE